MEANCLPAVEMLTAATVIHPDHVHNGPNCILRRVSKQLTTLPGSAFWGSTVFKLLPAASERADACSNHCIHLSGLSPDEDEKICLLAEILGWQVKREAPGLIEPVRGAEEGAGVRLLLRQHDGIIRVEAADPELRQQLARQGLDSLVSPVPLMALEQLLMFGG
jgi:hypothetical protein